MGHAVAKEICLERRVEEITRFINLEIMKFGLSSRKFLILFVFLYKGRNEEVRRIDIRNG